MLLPQPYEDKYLSDNQPPTYAGVAECTALAGTSAAAIPPHGTTGPQPSGSGAKAKRPRDQGDVEHAPQGERSLHAADGAGVRNASGVTHGSVPHAASCVGAP